MDTLQLQELLDRLMQDLPLREIAPPLALANAVDYVTESSPSPDQEELVEKIHTRYKALGREEVRQALEWEDAVEQHGEMTVYSLFLTREGLLVPPQDDYFETISTPRLGDPDPANETVLNTLSKSLHQVRTEQAQSLMQALGEQDTDY